MHRIDWTTVRFLLCAGLAALATGCQPTAERPGLALEEAKRLTADLQGQAGIAPHRSIEDIAAILDQEKPDPARIAALAARAKAVPPPGLAGHALAVFLDRRGEAAYELGLVEQSIRDQTEAARLADRGQPEYPKILATLPLAHLRAGNLGSAREAAEEALALSPRPPTKFGPYGALINIATRTGDLELARRRLNELEQLAERVRALPPEVLRINGNFWSAQVNTARGAYAGATGDRARAEAAYLAAAADWERQIPHATEMPGGNTEDWARERRDFVKRLAAMAKLHQGRALEAEALVREALLSRLRNAGKYNTGTVESIIVLARILLEQGRNAEAERLARVASEIDLQLGLSADSSVSVGTNAVLAETLALQGRWREADALYRGIEGAPPLVRRAVATSAYRPLAAYMTGDTERGLGIARGLAAGRASALGGGDPATAEARALVAMGLARLGRRGEAMAEYAAAIPILLATARAGDDETTIRASTDHRLRLILEDYMDALAPDPAAAAETFRLAEAARGQSVQRALALSGARAAASTPELADLVRREQDAGGRIGGLYGLLVALQSSPPEQRDAGAIDRLRREIDGLRAARATIKAEIGRRFPNYANLVDPKPATIADVQRVLGPDEALVAVFVGDSRTFVWAVPKSGAPMFAAAPAGRARIAELVADLRRALDVEAATLGDIPAFDLDRAHALYRILLQPVEAGWRDAKSLLVVPHGPLGQLPFALLPTAPAAAKPGADGMFTEYREVPWLVRRVAVTHLPSVTSLATLRALPAGKPERKPFVGFGDPLFSPRQAAEVAPQDSAAGIVRGALRRRSVPLTLRASSAQIDALPRLPETAAELRSVATALRSAADGNVFTAAEANERRVKTMTLSDRRVVMFATHGLVAGELDGLAQPALALTAPAVARTDDDGLLTMEEVLGLRLDADWVVLSACNTAAGDGAGAEAVSGLGRAFFFAGTRGLLVSNWPVETNSARLLTTDLFRRQADRAGLGRAEALRQTMLAMIDRLGPEQDGRLLFSYAHPIFWAPFTIVGDGG